MASGPSQGPSTVCEPGGRRAAAAVRLHSDHCAPTSGDSLGQTPGPLLPARRQDLASASHTHGPVDKGFFLQPQPLCLPSSTPSAPGGQAC